LHLHLTAVVRIPPAVRTLRRGHRLRAGSCWPGTRRCCALSPGG
jgi:hypothetical protein